MPNPKFRDKSWYDRFWHEKPKAFGAPNQEVTRLIRSIYDSLSSSGVHHPVSVDIAAGNGRYSFLLESIGFSVIAIDISGTACELMNDFARENRRHLAQVICGDYLKEDSLNKGTFELVFSSGLLEELNDSQQEDAIRKMRELVTSSGYILIKYCLEIDNRGQQVRDGFVESQFDQSWEVVKKIEHTEMKAYPQGVEGEGRIRTGLFCARKIA
jgi:hypothetical protein